MLLPSDDHARAVLGVVRATLERAGGTDDLARAVFDGVAGAVYGIDPADVVAVPPESARAVGATGAKQAVALLAVLEFVEHPLRREMVTAVEHTARVLDVDTHLLRDARDLANQHFGLLYMDLERQGWYRAETVRASLHGRWRELLRSKLAYENVVGAPAIARKWRALRDCPPGSWGRGVADFYERHGFPFPGERHGIYELGARHDWVHVLTDYETSPEGEIDVFAFIAASMVDERGLVLLAFTLGLFQNGSIHRVDRKVITTARADTLSEPGALARFADALRRGRACTVDVMGSLDLFAHKDAPLAEVRERFNVGPPAT